MKTLLLFVFLTATAFGQFGAPPTDQIRAELLVVRLPTARAIELQPELRDPSRIAAAQEKLLTMAKNKEAELVDWPIICTLSGNRAVAENVQEVRYPNQYESPKV